MPTMADGGSGGLSCLNSCILWLTVKRWFALSNGHVIPVCCGMASSYLSQLTLRGNQKEI
jgi:hypothetical protein